jgi:hypothetical protein
LSGNHKNIYHVLALPECFKNMYNLGKNIQHKLLVSKN